ncbi:MAG: radical SAM protein [Candidatus Symbiopectobacterium sp. Dall1.0]|nr:radical SAM protein [Candidatus Symbiopectobacterium sp. Dall1.0]
MIFMKFSSLINQCKYLFTEHATRLEKPRVIQFSVIDTCNSRCQMCRIWENKKSTDISVTQLRKGLASSLFSEVGGIGFNGGEPTLRVELAELVDVVVDSLPKLKHVSLITNAYKYSQVIEKIQTIAPIIKKKNINFDVMIPIDGYGEVHDRVRGRSGNFDNALKVIDFLQVYPLVDNIRIGCTVIRENVYHLSKLLEFCIKKGLYIKFRQGVPYQRLYTENLLDPYALTVEEKYEFVEFLEGLIKHYEKSIMQRFFYRSLIQQITNDGPRIAGCDWRHRGATITAKGELAYCAVQSKSLMRNISEGDPNDTYFSNEAHLKEIIKTKCASCHHDYVGIPAKEHYRHIFIERIDEKFKIKKMIRKTPGFNMLNNMRRKRAFNKNLNYYRSFPAASNILLNPDKKIKVLICGWYGTETLGDKAIIGGIIHSFKNCLDDDVQFVVVSLFEYITRITASQMPEFFHAKVVTPEEGISLIEKMDYVVFGGGPLMGIDTLAPMQAIFEIAKQKKIKTVIAGCGVGPYGEKWHNLSIKRILELADIRIYRDKRSKEYAAELGVDAINDTVAEDPAFTWLANSSVSKKIEKDSSEKKFLLLGLRDFPYEEYARHIPHSDRLNIKENYEKTIVKSLIILSEKYPGLIIKPLPMCTNHFGSDDRWFYRRLFRDCSELAAVIDDSLLGHEMAPIEYYNSFKSADALLAMRFHSLVFGLGIGVNSVALDYTLGKGKVRSLAEKYNTELISMIDLDEHRLIKAIAIALEAEKPNAISLNELRFTSSLHAELDKVSS